MTSKIRDALENLEYYAAQLPKTHYSHKFTLPAIEAMREVAARDEVELIQNNAGLPAIAPARGLILPAARWPFGTLLHKPRGASWHGRVCGYYTTPVSPIGYAIESLREENSVQVYPEAALEPWNP